MTRIRTIKPESFKDEKVVKLSREARLCRIVLLTMADDEGRFRCRRQEVIGHGYSEDEDAFGLLDGWIAEIKKTKAVLFYVVTRTPYGAFRHWAKHQVVNRPTPSDLPPPPDPGVVRDNGLVRVDTSKGSIWKQRARLTEDEMRALGLISEDSVSPHSSRAGAHSDPFLSVVVHLSEQLQGVCARTTRRHIRTLTAIGGYRTCGCCSRTATVTQGRSSGSSTGARPTRSGDRTFCRPGKLRKQFTQLVLKAESNVTPIKSAPSAPREPDKFEKAMLANKWSVGAKQEAKT